MCSTEIKLHCNYYCTFFNTARERKGKKALSEVWKFQNRKKTENTCQTAAGITNLIYFHEFRVGSRPFYGHLDDVRRWRHCKPPRMSRASGTGLLQCRQPLHVSIPRQKEKKSHSADAWRILLHHFLFSLVVLGTRNGSGCRRHRVPTVPPAVPEERGQMRGRCQRPGVKVVPKREILSLTPEFCSKGYLGSEWAGLTVSKDAHQPLVLNSLRKDRLPRKSCQEAAFLQSVFCVSQIELCTIATRISWGKRNAPRFIHIHTHTLSPRPVHTIRLWDGGWILLHSEQNLNSHCNELCCLHKESKIILCHLSQNNPFL